MLDYCGYGCELVAQAEYYLETGKFEKVENLANKAVYKAISKDQDGIILCAYFSLIRLKMAEGNFMEAMNVLDKLKEYFNDGYNRKIKSNNPVYRTTLNIVEGYVYANLKNLSKVPQWLQKGELDEATLLYKGMMYMYIVYAKAVMHSEDWIKLEFVCEEFMENLKTFHPQLGILYCLIYESVAKYKIYGVEKGKEVLLTALKAAQEDGIILPFAENAEHILPILDEIKENDMDSNWLMSIKNSCIQYRKNLQKFLRQKIPSLTNRERQVLELLDQGLTQKEIAKTLLFLFPQLKDT